MGCFTNDLFVVFVVLLFFFTLLLSHHQHKRAELYHNESNRFDFTLQRLTAPLLIINGTMYFYLAVMYMTDFVASSPWGSGACLFVCC